MTAKRLTLAQAAAHCGVHPKTLQRLDAQKKLPASGRTESGRRWYYSKDLDAFYGIKPAAQEERRPVVYCRVSSKAQKPDLANQKRILGDFCAARGLTDVQWVEEIGGGMNFARPKFTALMEQIERREVTHLVIAHKDRLARFGFEWFSGFAIKHGCEVLVLNNETMSPEQEMVEDLMTIVHCFSSRLYGLRKYRKALDTALKAEG